MPLNGNFGLGLSFGVDDRRVVRSQRQMSQNVRGLRSDVLSLGSAFSVPKDAAVNGFKIIGSTIESVTDKAMRFASTIGGAVTKGLDGLKQGAAGAFETVKNLNSGLNLTTSLEAEIQSQSIAAKKSLVNFGVMGKDLNKMGQQAVAIAQSQKLSAEDAAAAVHGWKDAQAELRAVGIKSATDFAKLSAQTGISSGIFRDNLLTMRKEFNFSDSELKSVTESMLSFGQASGDVAGNLNTLPQVIDLIRGRARGMGVELNSAELADFASQVGVLGKGFFSFNQNAEKSREMALAITTSMVESRNKFADMFTGVETELPSLLQEVGISFQDMGLSMDSLKQGPAEFVQSMAKVVTTARKMGKGGDLDKTLSFVEGRLGQAFGPEQAQMLVSYFRNADTASLALAAGAKGAASSLGDIAKTYNAGFTLQEAFEKTKDSFIMNFRAISKREAGMFVKDTGKEFKKFTGQLKGIVAEGGPLGALVEKMSLVHQIGALGLLPTELRPVASVMSTFAEAAQPAVEALHNFGINVSDVFSVSGLLKASILGASTWFAALKMQGKSTEEALTEMWDRAKDTAQGFWKGLTGAIDPKKGSSHVRDIAYMIGDGVKSAWKIASNIIVTEVWPRIVDFGAGAWDQVIGAVDPAKDPSGAYGVGAAFGEGVKIAVGWLLEQGEKLWEGVKEIAKGFWGGLTGSITATDGTGVGKSIGEAIGTAMKDALKSAAGAVANFVQENPKVSAMLALASGNPLGLAAAGGIFAADFINSATGRVSGNQKAIADKAMEEAQKKAQFDDKKVTSSLRATLGGAGYELDKDATRDSIANNKAGAIVAAIKAQEEALQREIIQFTQGGNAAMAAESTQKLTDLYDLSQRFQDVVTATSMQYKESNLNALNRIQEAMEMGELDRILAEVGMRNIDKVTETRVTNMQKGFERITNFAMSFWDKDVAASEAARAEVLANGIHMTRSVSLVGETTVTATRDTLDTMANLTTGTMLKITDEQKKVITGFTEGLFASLTSWKTALPMIGNEVVKLGEKVLPSLFGKKDGKKGVGAGAKDTTKSLGFAAIDQSDKKALQGNVDLIRKSVGEAAKNLDGPVRKTVEEVFAIAFQKAYIKVDKDTKTFTDHSLESFKSFGDSIKTIFRNTWTDVLGVVGGSIEAMQLDVDSAITKVSLLQSLSASAITASDMETTTLPPPIEMQLEDAGDMQMAMLEATHNPNWYEYGAKKQTEEIKSILATIALRLEGPKGARSASSTQKEAIQPKPKGKGK